MIDAKISEALTQIAENKDFTMIKNSNGVAYQFPNRLQICTCFIHHEYTPTVYGTSGFGYYNWENVWTYPYPFTDTYPFATLVSVAGNGFWAGNVLTSSTGIQSALVWNNGANILCKSNLMAIAIGSYK